MGVRTSTYAFGGGGSKIEPTGGVEPAICQLLFLNKFIYLLINLFLAVLGLCCCAWAFSSCGEQGLLFVAVCGLLIAVASLVAEHRL